MPELVLASASPRRSELLSQIGIVPDVIEAADLEETANPGEMPRAHAARLAKEKAKFISAKYPNAWVLGADTVVACGRRILPKAENVDTAKACLEILSGRRHRVYGGITVVRPSGRITTRMVETRVRFKRLERIEIEAYLTSEEWRGKAGGYAIQGRAAAFVADLNGSYSNVVGLALFEASALLREHWSI